VHVTFEHVVGIVLLAVGTAVVAWSVWELVQAISSSRWLQTEGVILVSDLQRTRDAEGGYSYRPEISYRYQVGGSEFVASRYKFGAGMSLSWSGPAARATQKFPIGSRVTVFYDPADPQEAVLESGVTSLVWLSLAGGAIFLALGFGAFFANI
jgi:hypothetical protein